MKLPVIKLGFSFKLTGFLLAISVLPLSLFYLVSYSATRLAIMEEAQQQNKLLLVGQRDYLNLQMEQISGLATNLGSVEEINLVLSTPRSDSQSQTTYDQLATKARMGYVLSGYSGLRGLVSIDIFTLNNNQYHVGDTLNVDNVRADLRDQLMQRSFESGNRLTWHGVEDNVNAASTSRKVVVATKPLYRDESSQIKPAGLLVINYSTEYLYSYFSKIDLGKDAYLMITDAQHRLLFHPSKMLIGHPIENELSNLLTGSFGSLSLRLDGRDVLLSYIQVPDKQWHVISVVPQATLMAPMKQIGRVGMGLMALNFLLIALFIRSYLRQVVFPIRGISEGFKRFYEKQLDPQWRMAKQKTLDEIDELVTWFNTFLDTVESNRQAEVALSIAATAFESQEGILITDANTVILRVNKAFTEITGYMEEEAVGQKMILLKSGRHDETFYSSMWDAINKTGSWQGEIWNRRKSGEVYPEWLTISAVKGGDGEVTHYVGTMTDITTRKEAEAEIKHLAFYDALTQLPNRRLLHDRLLQAMSASRRNGRYGALMFLDLDNFKPLNDAHGHDVGDLLLIEVAGRITSCVRDTDTVARFGGDEFVVMLSELDVEKTSSMELARSVAEKIRLSLAAPYSLTKRSTGEEKLVFEHHCTSSIGVIVFFGHEYSDEDILKWADIAMYDAKKAGRNSIRFYS